MPAQASQAMVLDPEIRDWVLLPIMVVMVGVGVLRHYLTLCLASTPTPTLAGVRESSALARARALRAAAGTAAGVGALTGRPYCLLPPSAFLARKQHLCSGLAAGTYLKVPVVEGQAPPNPLADAQGLESMMGMMKGNMMMLVPQTVIMAWITAFFSGFVLTMLQRGIETADMDVTWVSSISWYFLNLFGLRCLFTLLLGNGNAASESMQQQMAMVPGMAPAGGLQQPTETAKMFKGEKEFLDLIPIGGANQAAAMEEEELSFMEGVEERLLAKYRFPIHSSSAE